MTKNVSLYRRQQLYASQDSYGHKIVNLKIAYEDSMRR